MSKIKDLVFHRTNHGRKLFGSCRVIWNRAGSMCQAIGRMAAEWFRRQETIWYIQRPYLLTQTKTRQGFLISAVTMCIWCHHNYYFVFWGRYFGATQSNTSPCWAASVVTNGSPCTRRWWWLQTPRWGFGVRISVSDLDENCSNFGVAQRSILTTKRRVRVWLVSILKRNIENVYFPDHLRESRLYDDISIVQRSLLFRISVLLRTVNRVLKSTHARELIRIDFNSN